MTNGAARIMVIEDNPGDFLLIEKAFERAKISNELENCDDGEGALARLREGAETQRLPDLVLLDLSLPGMDGKDVLTSIRADALLRRLPVVVMSSSQQERDIVASYELGASSFVTKPPTLGALQELVRALHEYWFVFVRLPRAMEGGARG